jgi:replicative DNA helicase
MGKTAFALNIAQHAALESGTGVAVFSLEMSKEQLVFRMLCSEARVDQSKVRAGYAANKDYPKLALAADRLSEVPIYIDDTPALSNSAMRTRARRRKRSRGLGLIVIDYLQLIAPSPGSRHDNRVQELSEITRGLKTLAKELEVPVLALSQLSRAVEQREDKRPQLSDLRESGTIEQDADVVMFIFREQYYLERTEPSQRPDESEDKFQKRHEDWMQRCERAHNLAEVMIAKQRHGPIGTVKLFFGGEFTRFGDLDPRDGEG